MKILTWDIETAPAVADVWSLFNTNVSLSQLRKPQRVICFAAKWYGEREVQFFSEWDDGTGPMRDAAYELLDEADAVVSYNGKSFDTKHLNWEFAKGGYAKPSPYREIDLRAVVKRHFRPTSGKLDFVASELLGQKKVEHEGHKLWVRVLAEDPAARKLMEKYNRQDVRLTEKLYTRLVSGGWLDQHNSFLCEHLNAQKRGYTHDANGRRAQRYRCSDCNGWFQSGQKLDPLPNLRRITS